MSAASLFQRLRFVLVETSRSGNVGSAARAMKTMGFTDLVLVKPRHANVLHDEEAVALSSGATDVLQAARIVDSLEAALEGCNYSVALSARLREFSPPCYEPRELVAGLASQPELKIALVFGNERFGLANEHVEMCNALVTVPTNPAYSSLNLSQAVQILAYEFRLAAIGKTREPSSIGFCGDLASTVEVDGMFEHLEQALVAIEFLDPDKPRKLMPRLRRLFSRTQLETEEVNILRGIATQLMHRRQRFNSNK